MNTFFRTFFWGLFALAGLAFIVLMGAAVDLYPVQTWFWVPIITGVVGGLVYFALGMHQPPPSHGGDPR